MLCIGGLDSSGRAGLTADAWAVWRAGGAPVLIPTALTAQGGRRFSLNPVAPAVLRAQLSAAVAAGPVHAVKLGMVANRRQLREICSALKKVRVPWVVDPVTLTSRGERLSSLTAADYLSLARPNVWLTPNVAEQEWLRHTPGALVAHGFGAVLVKGVDLAVDLLVVQQFQRSFRARPVRRDPTAHRGTGCRLASALATRLGQGDSPAAAVLRSRRIVLQFLRAPIMRAASFGRSSIAPGS